MKARVRLDWLLAGWLLCVPVGGNSDEAVDPELLEFLGAVVEEGDELLVLLDEPALWAMNDGATQDEHTDDEQASDDE